MRKKTTEYKKFQQLFGKLTEQLQLTTKGVVTKLTIGTPWKFAGSVPDHYNKMSTTMK